MRDFARRFYKSKAWKATRDAYMRHPVETEAGTCPPGMCERCFASGLLVAAEIVHHRIHVEPDTVNDPNVTLDFGNLERLCRKCHADEHPEIYGRKPEDAAPRVRFDVDGNVVRIEGR